MSTTSKATATIKNTGLRVQTLVIAATKWAWEVSKIAEEYSLSEAQVLEALKFYEAHKAEIDDAIAAELAYEAAHA